MSTHCVRTSSPFLAKFRLLPLAYRAFDLIALCGSLVWLYTWDPARLQRTPAFDINKEAGRLIATVSVLFRSSADVQYDVYSEDGNFAIRDRDNQVQSFRWLGQPKLLDQSKSLFGYLTSVWEGLVQESLDGSSELGRSHRRLILKTCFQPRKRAFHEGDILK